MGLIRISISGTQQMFTPLNDAWGRGENNHYIMCPLCVCHLEVLRYHWDWTFFYSISHLNEIQEWRKQRSNIKRQTSLFCSVRIKYDLDHHFSSDPFVSWIHHIDPSPANWNGRMGSDAWLNYSFCGAVQFGSFQSPYCYIHMYVCGWQKYIKVSCQ